MGTRLHAQIIVAGLVFSLLGAATWAWRQAKDSQPIVSVPEVWRSPPDLPPLHLAMMRALRTRRELSFKDVSAKECLADLSDTLGMEVRIHPSLAKSLEPRMDEWKLTMKSAEPVSHQTAIQAAMMELGVAPTGIVFGDDCVWVTSADFPQPALRTLDLRHRADLSLGKRESLLSEAVNLVPHAWESPDADSESEFESVGVVESDISPTTLNHGAASLNTWIVPGESVFELDVYQTPEVYQALVQALCNVACAPDDPDVATLISFGAESEQASASFAAVQSGAVERLKERYGYESLVSRLAYEQAGPSVTSSPLDELAPDILQRLSDRDADFDPLNIDSVKLDLRAESLRLLHEEEVAAFVGRPGAGKARMPPPGPFYLPPSIPPPLRTASDFPDVEAEPLVSLPRYEPPTTPIEDGPGTRHVYLPSMEIIKQFHFQAEALFAPSASLGYFKDLGHVAGFEEHRLPMMTRIETLRRRPQPQLVKSTEMWVIRRLELVSLLKYSIPNVYITHHLPRMDELPSQVRTLNPFEKAALPQLRSAKDVVVRASLNRIELLGSVRATKHCLQCHNVQRGALLGAFSYELLRDPPAMTEEN